MRNVIRNQTKENQKLEGLRGKVENQTKNKGILGDLEDKKRWSANLTQTPSTNSNKWRGEDSQREYKTNKTWKDVIKTPRRNLNPSTKLSTHDKGSPTILSTNANTNEEK